jgi:phosphonate transport system substrate-binding protein
MQRLAITAGLVVVLAGCGAKETKPVLRYSAIPDQNTTELAEKFAPLTAYLSQTLGVPVEYVPSRDYQATVEMFRNGDIQLAWFGGLTGVQARAMVPGATAIAQGDVDPRYVSYFVANASTGLAPQDAFPDALSDLTFTFGSESSTSGRLMPEYYLREATGKSPAEFFTHPFSFSGSHDKTLELVASGQYQAGVVNYMVYDKRVASGKTDSSVVRVIWRTPPYADYNFTAHPILETTYGAGFTNRLRDALVAIKDPALLAALPRQSLVPATNDAYAGIEKVARDLGMLR